MKEKLVRDKIPEIIKKNGQNPDIRQAGRDEFLSLLREKLLEESSEFSSNPCMEELSDVLEVVIALAGELGVTWEELENARCKKRAERGGFAERIVLREP